jgi:acetylornithine deacetylase/succinyl-diaminopimelate desuccinylase-like protein
MADWATYFENNSKIFLKQLYEILRIPSISCLKDHVPNMHFAAEWIAKRLSQAKIQKINIMQTGGHPVVYGEWIGNCKMPTILIYGHYDVQPIDPIELWKNPPFEPILSKNCIYARGASDEKSNLLISIISAEAILKTKGFLPVNLKFLFEGEEEIGSPNLANFVSSNKDLLACDLVLNTDSLQWSENTPSLTLGLRGICGLQLDIYGANKELHSGSFGGTLQNPIDVLVHILDSMRSSDGKINIDGFYDSVASISETEINLIKSIPHDDDRLKEELGVDELFGEPGYTTLEREFIRPTIDVNGIWGGFQEEGIKTIIPKEAHAKITSRLVPNQEPENILKLISDHILNIPVSGVEVHVSPLSIQAMPYLVPFEHPGNRAAENVLSEIYQKTPLYLRDGASVPVTNIFLEHLKAYSINFGFSLKDENQHAPNEFFRLSNFERGLRAYCMMLYELANEGLLRKNSALL